jgi:hypothetical protein
VGDIRSFKKNLQLFLDKCIVAFDLYFLVANLPIHTFWHAALLSLGNVLDDTRVRKYTRNKDHQFDHDGLEISAVDAAGEHMRTAGCRIEGRLPAAFLNLTVK